MNQILSWKSLCYVLLDKKSVLQFPCTLPVCVCVCERGSIGHTYIGNVHDALTRNVFFFFIRSFVRSLCLCHSPFFLYFLFIFFLFNRHGTHTNAHTQKRIQWKKCNFENVFQQHQKNVTKWTTLTQYFSTYSVLDFFFTINSTKNSNFLLFASVPANFELVLSFSRNSSIFPTFSSSV